MSAAVSFDMLEALAQPRPNHWARVWPSAIAVCGWLLEQEAGALGVEATELGCGVGLVSMTLAHLGLTVEGTDREPLALAFARHNAVRNSVAGFTASHLEWSVPGTATTALLLGADILYDAGSPQHLFELIHTSGLLRPGGRLILGVPQTRLELPEVLLESLRSADYVDLVHARHILWDGRDEAIDLHVLARPR